MKRHHELSFVLLVLLTVLLLTLPSRLQSADREGRAKLAKTEQTLGSPANTMININNIASWIGVTGRSALNPSTAQAGTYYPRGTTTCIFQDGIVWGGNVNDGGSQILRIGGQTYSVATQGGKIVSAGVAEDPNAPDVRVYRIRRDYATADLTQDASDIYGKALTAVTEGDIQGIRNQYATDWNQWPVSMGAPYYERNGVPGYQPPAANPDGSPILGPDVDEPGVADADQVIWFVCNDLNSGLTNALSGSNPIGMELQVTLWGYNRTDPLANVFFKKFTFIYKGTATSAQGSTINDMYVCQWSDPDNGDSGDDFAGCDTTLSLVYAYNGGASDSYYAAFGLKPPAIGYDFLQGPIVNGAQSDTAIFGLHKVPGKKNLPMTAAFYFAAGGTYSDPPFSREGGIQWYNLLRGLTPISGTPFIHPAFPGQPTRFWLDGDPVTGQGRVDGVIDQPGDRRIGACSGPFTMTLGDTQEVVVGVVAGIGADYLNSVTVMKNNDVAVQSAYDNLFDLPKAPPAPKLLGVALNNQIVLDWGSTFEAVKTTEEFDRQGYTFEGYNVYQLPASNAGFEQATPLATYDIVDGVRTIYDLVFDANLGIIKQVILQKGKDTGIRRSMNITQDRIRTAPLVNGQRYYFAVTAYGYNPSEVALTHALESSLQIVTVVPQSTNPGTRYYSAYGDSMKVSNTNPGKKSDGIVVATVVDPAKVTGKQYNVRFQSVLTDFVYGPDTIQAPIVNWYLIRGTADTMYRSTNQGPTVIVDPGNGDNIAPRYGNLFDYPIIDGLFVTVSGPPPLINEARTTWTGTEWWTNASGVDDPFPLGGPGAEKLRYQASTGADMGNYFGAVGSTLDASQYVDIEFRFADGGTLTQKAYRYNRGATPQETGSQYKFRDYSTVPFQVWDISGSTPRQLNCGYRDQDLSGAWEPSGDVEAIFVPKSTYDGDNPTTFTYGTTVGTSTDNIVRQDVMYIAEWISDNLVQSDIKTSTIHISPNYVNSPTDIFAFTSAGAPTYDASTAKTDITAVNVFPNPYYGFNRAETSRYQRFVTFNHLPPKVEIRIFNLSGVLVRSLLKDGPGQYFTWDLNNQNGLPVASGVYIAYVSMPDIGETKTLKMVIIQEQQYLENF